MHSQICEHEHFKNCEKNEQNYSEKHEKKKSEYCSSFEKNMEN